MQVTTKITVDLTRQNVGQRVNAVQGDGNTRSAEITLLSGGQPWTPPEGVEAAIAYMQPSGTKGMYNLLADGTAAISITGNVATIVLAPQMLTVSGTVQASLVFNDAALNRLTTFPFAVSVTSNPAAGAQKVEDYLRLQWLEDKLDEYLKKYDGLTDDAIVRRIVDEYLTANPPTVTETDPTVPAWAKQPQKPTYTAAEVGALPDTYTPPDQTAQQVGADPAGTASSAVSQHNTDTAAHNDLRLALQELANRVNAALDSDDTTLDQMSEAVAYIKSNKSLIDAIATSKVSVEDIVNDLATNVADKPLSAAQGVVLKGLVEELRTLIPEAYTLPTATETTLGGVKAEAATEDMTQPVGITADGKLVTVPSPDSGGNVDLTGVVKSVNGKTPDENGNVEITVSDETTVQQVVEDYLAANPPEVTETDPTVPAWAKQPQKPTYTAAEVGALPDTYTPPDQTAQQVGALAVSGGDVTGEIRMNGQPISGLNDPTEDTQAARKGYVDTFVRKAAPRNLLDNSDWRKPSGIVNQRGETTYSGNKYTIDRWRTYSGKATVTIGSGYLEITDALMQFLDIDPDMVYTAAVCKADGSVVLTSGTFRAGFGNSSLGIRCSYTNSLCRFLMEPSLGNVAWAALYEGEYTADNLPVYQPKGYMTELAECQRYYQRVGRLLSTGAAATGFMFNNTSARFAMSISPMRKNNPTVNLVSSASKPSVISNGNVLAEGALTFTTNAYKDDQHLVIAVTVSGGTQYANAVLVSDKDCYFEISADL